MKHLALTAFLTGLAGFCLGDAPVPQANAAAQNQGPAAKLLAPQLVLRCPARQAPQVRCSLRLNPAQRVDAIEVTAEDGRPVNLQVEPYPGAGDRTAALFLVDTGNPRHPAILARQRADLIRIIGRSQNHHRLGLATLDNELSVGQPLGAERQALLRAVKALAPTGTTSELYRTTLDAVRVLAADDASRRALFLFSDGLADDRAYFHQDVVAAAATAGVAIVGLGYAETPEEAPALQTLRRLSEDTGGIFVAADGTGGLPESFLDDPFAALDSGDNVVVTVPAVPEFRSELALVLRVTAGDHALERTIPVTPPIADASAGPLAPGPVRPSAPQATPRPDPAAPTMLPGRGEAKSALGLGELAVLAGTVLLFGASAVFLWRRRAHPSAGLGRGGPLAPPSPPPAPDSPPRQAYLTQPGAAGHAPFLIPITGASIGRNADNDLRLDDPSVSRHHARLGWDPRTGFHVSDLGSLNGVYVNDRQVKNAVLQNGDRMEVGDIRLQFHLGVPPDAPGGEQTDPERTVVSSKNPWL